jgi:hypothetical protein
MELTNELNQGSIPTTTTVLFPRPHVAHVTRTLETTGVHYTNPEFLLDNWFNDRIATDESLNDNMEVGLIFMGRLFSSTGTSQINGVEGMGIGDTTA